MKRDAANNYKNNNRKFSYIAIRSPLSTQAVSVLGNTRITSTGSCKKKYEQQKM